jgi:hypothetical protein
MTDFVNAIEPEPFSRSEKLGVDALRSEAARGVRGICAPGCVRRTQD